MPLYACCSGPVGVHAFMSSPSIQAQQAAPPHPPATPASKWSLGPEFCGLPAALPTDTTQCQQQRASSGPLAPALLIADAPSTVAGDVGLLLFGILVGACCSSMPFEGTRTNLI